MIRPRLMSSCSTGWRIHRWFHLVAQRADVKLAGVKRTDLKRAEVKRTDVKRTYAQLADVKGMGVNGATEEGTHVIVPNYYPRPPGCGSLTLARLLTGLRNGYCLCFYCGCTSRRIMVCGMLRVFTTGANWIHTRLSFQSLFVGTQWSRKSPPWRRSDAPSDFSQAVFWSSCAFVMCGKANPLPG